MEGLPQDEPLFDVSTIPSEAFSASFKLLRNLVIINVNAENKAETIKYRSNVWAKDQGAGKGREVFPVGGGCSLSHRSWRRIGLYAKPTPTSAA